VLRGIDGCRTSINFEAGRNASKVAKSKYMKKRAKKQNSNLKTRPVRAWTLAKRLEHRRVGSNKKNK